MKIQVSKLIAIIIAMTLLCVSKAVGAEREYLPILEDGKSWVTASVRYNRTPDRLYYDTVYYDVKVVGDITVDGRLCKKLSKKQINGDKSFELIEYEENGKLYAVNEGFGLIPLVDMTLEKGDSINALDGSNPAISVPDVYFNVYDSKTLQTPDGKDRKVLIVGMDDPSGVWIEGIGADGNSSMILQVLPTSMDSYSYTVHEYIISCMKDGEVLYTNDDYKQLLGDVGYKPLLKEGKVWVWNAADHSQQRFDVPVYFTVTGQETVDDRNCFRVRQTSELESLNGHEYLLCEENLKVEMRFVFEDGHAEFFPLYDFNMKPGEQCQVLEVTELEVREPDPSNVMEVKAEEEVTANGRLWRRIKLEDKGWNDRSAVWVEGIGAPYDSQMMTRFYLPEADDGIYLMGFRECIDEGKTVFTMSDFGDTVSIEAIPSEVDTVRSDAPIYDMLGRCVPSMTHGGIYIRDGKKFVNLSQH